MWIDVLAIYITPQQKDEWTSGKVFKFPFAVFHSRYVAIYTWSQFLFYSYVIFSLHEACLRNRVVLNWVRFGVWDLYHLLEIGIGQMSAFDLLFSVWTKHLDYYQCNETSVTADSSSATKARNLHCSRLAVVSIFTDAENWNPACGMWNI